MFRKGIRCIILAFGVFYENFDLRHTGHDKKKIMDFNAESKNKKKLYMFTTTNMEYSYEPAAARTVLLNITLIRAYILAWGASQGKKSSGPGFFFFLPSPL